MGRLSVFSNVVKGGWLLAAVVALGALPVALEELVPLGASAHAAEDEKPRQKTRRVPSMSEAVFKKLAEAQEAVDAKDYDSAIRVLTNMLGKSRYNQNEIGQVHNMLGFAYFAKEDYPRAIDNYKKVVEQGDKIPEGLEVTTLYTLAQLSFVTERYDDALRYMETWLSKANNPSADPYIFLGQVYYQKKDYGKAITQIEKGIRVAEERGTETKENWWALLNFMYYEAENWPRVLETLEYMVERWPKREYWVRLAGIHGTQGNENEQLWTMEAAHVADMFERSSDFTNLAGLLMQEEVPIRAANVLKEGIEKKVVERNAKNLQSWGQALQMAQETDDAIEVFEEAAKLSDDGKIYERLSHLYLDDDQFKRCVTASDNALNKGGLRKKQTVHLVKGMCLNNQEKLTAARQSFVSCRNTSRQQKDESNQRICQQWITFIDRTVERNRKLAEAGASL